MSDNRLSIDIEVVRGWLQINFRIGRSRDPAGDSQWLG